MSKRHSVRDKFEYHQLELTRANVANKKDTGVAKSTDPQAQDVRKLFIGGLPGLTTLEEFKNHFRQFGEIEDALVPKKLNDPTMNCGFGFVTFRRASAAAAVLKSTNNQYFRSKLVSSLGGGQSGQAEKLALAQRNQNKSKIKFR